MTSPPLAPTLVLALGNPDRGDDGVGQAVLRDLTERGPLPPTVEVLDGGLAGLETCLLLQGRRRALIVDAADMGLAPGEWRSLEVTQPLLAGEPRRHRSQAPGGPPHTPASQGARPRAGRHQCATSPRAREAF